MHKEGGKGGCKGFPGGLEGYWGSGGSGGICLTTEGGGGGSGAKGYVSGSSQTRPSLGMCLGLSRSGITSPLGASREVPDRPESTWEHLCEAPYSSIPSWYEGLRHAFTPWLNGVRK